MILGSVQVQTTIQSCSQKKHHLVAHLAHSYHREQSCLVHHLTPLCKHSSSSRPDQVLEKKHQPQQYTFSSRWYLWSMRWKKPTCAPPCPLEVFPVLPLILKWFPHLSAWRWPFPTLSSKIVKCFLFLHLSPPGSWWWDVLGFQYMYIKLPLA